MRVSLGRLGIAIVAIGLTSASLTAQESKEQVEDKAALTGEAHIKGHQYELDNAHSRISFRIRHMAVAWVRGSFGQVSASIHLDPSDITTLAVEAVIPVASVNTDNERRDNDLRSENFFDVIMYPDMKFAATKVSDVGDDGTFKLHGKLTIRDVTRDIVLDAEFSGPIVSNGRERIGFVATTRIDRFDYGLTWDALTEAGGLVAGRDVDIIVEVEARRDLE